MRDIPGKITELVIKYRVLVLLAVLILTGFFGYQLKYLEIYTKFADLLPAKHPYIKVYDQFRDVFGGANLITIMVQTKQGDIYNPKTLEKIQKMTRDMDMAPGVNHYQVISLAHIKVRELRITAEGHLEAPVFMREIPQTEEQLMELRQKVHRNSEVFGKLVSLDDTAALIYADFIQERLSYSKLFTYIKAMQKREEDENTKIYITGQPMLYGWVYHYGPEMAVIFIITFIIMLMLLIFYFRRTIGVLLPLLSAGISAIWGLGFASFLGYNLDPLIFVLPLLVTARAISHSVQYCERFFEEYEITGDKKVAATNSMAELLKPGFLGIFTDGLGTLTIAIATIPIMRKLAFFTTFWVMSIIFSVQFLNPILLTLLPAPKQRVHFTMTFMNRYLATLGSITTGKKSKWFITCMTAVLIIGSIVIGEHIVIGDPRPGSPILKRNSEYNISADKINKHFLGSNQFVVVVSGKKADSIKHPLIFKEMEAFQRYLEDGVNVAKGGGKGVHNLVKVVNRVLHNGDPKWYALPESRKEVGEYLFQFLSGASNPNILDEYIAPVGEYSSLTIFYKDQTAETTWDAVKRAKEFIANHPIEDYEYLLAGGSIGVFAAQNEEIAYSNIWNLVLVFITVFASVALLYQSIIAAILVSVSLATASLLSIAYMVIKDIGINVNTLPVQAVGIGVGVDYAIYIIDRVIQEYGRCGEDYDEAIKKAIRTTGMAVSFTATTLVGGIVFWFILSSLRFQAEMSVLLSIIMVVNMFGATLTVPALFSIIRPKFVRVFFEKNRQ